MQMDSLLISAAGGMKARITSLDILANNLANSGTAGFKADREFYGLFEGQLPVIEKQWTDFSQGVLVATGNPSQVALEGDGFFAVTSPAGVAYTRNGDFRISSKNQLETATGAYPFRNSLDPAKPITVDPSKPIEIDRAGVVRQAGQIVGKLEIAGFDPGSGVAKMGSTYFAISEVGTSPRAANAVVHQGMIEQSNVPVADSAVRLVSVMRQFEMLQRAVGVGAEMNRSALDEVAKTG